MLEQIFNRDYCQCRHSISTEHDERGICYALDFNGAIFSACDCRSAKPVELKFEVPNANNIPDTGQESSPAISPNKKPNQVPFNWGTKISTIGGRI